MRVRVCVRVPAPLLSSLASRSVCSVTTLWLRPLPFIFACVSLCVCALRPPRRPVLPASLPPTSCSPTSHGGSLVHLAVSTSFPPSHVCPLRWCSSSSPSRCITSPLVSASALRQLPPSHYALPCTCTRGAAPRRGSFTIPSPSPTSCDSCVLCRRSLRALRPVSFSPPLPVTRSAD